MALRDTELVRRLRWEATEDGRRSLAGKEWLVTNGLGGYASGTVAGALTRRYHGVLIAALPTPFGRTLMLNYIWEQVRFRDGRVVAEGWHEGPGTEHAEAMVYLAMIMTMSRRLAR